ncbi:MAG: YggS family pyridoxal phosphate-dependent enzyme [Bacteroidota bacterium]
MIAENIKILEEKIALKCSLCKRDRSEIKLIAVSKTQPVEIIMEALNSSIKNLGENKAQELRDKAELVNGDFIWHFIGHLQTNKVKYVIKSAEYIHSVDSIKLADEINSKAKQIDKCQKILLEINTSDEATKFGLKEENEILELADHCKNLSNVKLIGLMTMAPYTENEKVIRCSFAELRNKKEKLNSLGFNLTELSMGMTNDYEIAIEEGSTMLRIGTAIFGERKYN